jgi:hypothetical protein
MYYVNTPGQTQQEKEDNEEERKDYPTSRMLESLVYQRKLWTCDWRHFFLLMDTYDGQEVAGCVCLDIIGNSHLPIEVVEKNTLHVRWVCTRNDWRQCGFLSVIMQYLIEGAEEFGLFLHLHARPFEIDLPKLANKEEVEKWIEEDKGKHNPSLKNDKQNAKIMKKKYRAMGFCSYDGVGIRFSNRWWRTMCCGYRSSRIENRLLNRYLDSHLHCN